MHSHNIHQHELTFLFITNANAGEMRNTAIHHRWGFRGDHLCTHVMAYIWNSESDGTALLAVKMNVGLVAGWSFVHLDVPSSSEGMMRNQTLLWIVVGKFDCCYLLFSKLMDYIRICNSWFRSMTEDLDQEDQVDLGTKLKPKMKPWTRWEGHRWLQGAVPVTNDVFIDKGEG